MYPVGKLHTAREDTKELLTNIYSLALNQISIRQKANLVQRLMVLKTMQCSIIQCSKTELLHVVVH